MERVVQLEGNFLISSEVPNFSMKDYSERLS